MTEPYSDCANAIEARGLIKSYKGSAVLRDLSFMVPRGSICGFVGLNGAGKTTTLRILLGFARAHAGQAYLLGRQTGDTARDMTEINRRVGFVPEIKEPFPYAYVDEALRLARGFYPQWDSALEARLLDEFQLPLGRRCRKLSKGMSASLSLLMAVCKRPELLILDEPTDSLDPVVQERVLKLLVEQVAESGATVFFSTHRLEEVEQIADRVVVLAGGRCAVEGALDDIKERNRRVRCVMDREGPLPDVVRHFSRDGRVLSGFTAEAPEEFATRMAAEGIAVLDSQPATLKEVFLAQVRDEQPRLQEVGR